MNIMTPDGTKILASRNYFLNFIRIFKWCHLLMPTSLVYFYSGAKEIGGWEMKFRFLPNILGQTADIEQIV